MVKKDKLLTPSMGDSLDGFLKLGLRSARWYYDWNSCQSALVDNNWVCLFVCVCVCVCGCEKKTGRQDSGCCSVCLTIFPSSLSVVFAFIDH